MRDEDEALGLMVGLAGALECVMENLGDHARQQLPLWVRDKADNILARYNARRERLNREIQAYESARKTSH
jgi:hypothetical protein